MTGVSSFILNSSKAYSLFPSNSFSPKPGRLASGGYILQVFNVDIATGTDSWIENMFFS